MWGPDIGHESRVMGYGRTPGLERGSLRFSCLERGRGVRALVGWQDCIVVYRSYIMDSSPRHNTVLPTIMLFHLLQSIVSSHISWVDPTLFVTPLRKTSLAVCYVQPIHYTYTGKDNNGDAAKQREGV